MGKRDILTQIVQKKKVRLLEEDFKNVRNDLEEISDISYYEGKEVYMVKELEDESE